MNSKAAILESDPARAAGPLLSWYERKRRDLPWRRDPDPYRVWISEVMLQQTRVEVVVPRYLRFLERFPDLPSLARAREAEVLAEWSGLGYYRRARALLEAARAIVRDHGGRFPRELEAALALPGVGRYTAGAVLSIAYDLPVPLLDGNAARVLARLFRVPGDPRGGAAGRRLWELAERLLPRRSPSRFNQALMELGATVCLPGTPRCGECPLGSLCEGRRRGDAARFPQMRAGRPPLALSLIAAVVEERGRFLLERRDAGGPAYLRRLWGFPLAESAGGEGADLLARRITEACGARVRAGGLLGEVRHSITFRRITLRAFRFHLAGSSRLAREAASGGSRWRWAPLPRLGRDLPASSLALKVKALARRPAP